MKSSKLYPILAAALMISSCGEKKDNPAQAPVNDTTIESTAPQGVVEERAREMNDTVDWQGAQTIITINRKPDAEGGTVKDESNVEYRDNYVALKISKNGSTIVDKKFTKSDFHGYIDDKIYNRYILEGFVFDKEVNGTLVFAASVANPTQEDEYVPFKIEVSANGNVSIAKDNGLESAAPADELGD